VYCQTGRNTYSLNAVSGLWFSTVFRTQSFDLRGRVTRVQVCKVYIGSFNADKPIRSDLNPAGLELFEKEQADLLQDLYDIPQRACDRKVDPS